MNSGTPPKTSTPWTVVFALGGLMLLCAAPYPFTTIILDAARDLVFATQIAQGEAFPLQGPVINAVAHLGPFWFYLLAPVLGLTKSTAATLFFVGLLDALKFPLAYAIGARVGGRRLGLWFALALAFPNWALGAAMLVTHTSVVQTMVLAVVWSALRLPERNSAAAWATLGLTLSLSLHAHPASVVLFPLLLWLVWARRTQSWGRELRGWSIAAVFALLPFAPMLFDEMRHGWPIAQRWSHYTDHHDWSDPLQVLFGSLFGGAALLSEHLADAAWRWPLRLLVIGTAAAGLMGLLRFARNGERRGPLWGCLAALTLGVVGLALLRERTPFYMSLLLWPATAGLLALGWDTLARRRSIVGVSLALSVTLLALASAFLPILRAEQGVAKLPTSAFFDVAQWRAPSDTKALLPAWRLDRFGRTLCARDDRVVLHAELGTLFDSALGLSMRLNCGSTANIGIGGGTQDAAVHRLGLPPQALRELGLIADASWSAALRAAPTSVIASDLSVAIPDGRRYPFRLQDLGEPRVHTWEFEAEPEQTVLLTTSFRPYDGAERLEARANGDLQSPAFDSYATSAFRCRACTRPVRWQVQVRTGYPERVDVVLASPTITSTASHSDSTD